MLLVRRWRLLLQLLLLVVVGGVSAYGKGRGSRRLPRRHHSKRGRRSRRGGIAARRHQWHILLSSEAVVQGIWGRWNLRTNQSGAGSERVRLRRGRERQRVPLPPPPRRPGVRAVLVESAPADDRPSVEPADADAAAATTTTRSPTSFCNHRLSVRRAGWLQLAVGHAGRLLQPAHRVRAVDDVDDPGGELRRDALHD